jgi:Rho termination factor, N-terminal domain
LGPAKVGYLPFHHQLLEGIAMSDQVWDRTSNAPSKSEIRETKADDLRAEAKEAGVTGTSDMRKDELVHEVAKLRSGSTSDGDGAGRDGRKVRTGDHTSSSLKNG